MHGIKNFVGSVSIIIMMMYVRFKVIYAQIPSWNIILFDRMTGYWIYYWVYCCRDFFFYLKWKKSESTMGNEQCYAIFMESSSLLLLSERVVRWVHMKVK